MEYRPRRLRKKEGLRRMVSDIKIKAEDLILPLFLVPGEDIKEEITALPDCYHLSVDRVVEYLKEPVARGLNAVLLFGVPEENQKDAEASQSRDPEGVVPRAVKKIKDNYPELVVGTDVCLCAYTDHGHCGIMDSGGEVKNDETLDYLARMALTHTRAGADIIAPSDMMDYRIGFIRRVLEEEGFTNTVIMSYSVKYASSFYGPFRYAADSAPEHGDRSSYQMDYSRSQEASIEAELDIQEGADILMVKPALAYLDIIKEIDSQSNLPLAAYSVSGEYSMIKQAAKAGICNEEEMVHEVFTAIRRAGADIIISYFAEKYLQILSDKK